MHEIEHFLDLLERQLAISESSAILVSMNHSTTRCIGAGRARPESVRFHARWATGRSGLVEISWPVHHAADSADAQALGAPPRLVTLTVGGEPYNLRVNPLQSAGEPIGA